MIFRTSPSVHVVYLPLWPMNLTRAYAQSKILSFPTEGAFPETINYADLFSNCTTRAAGYTSSVDTIQLFDQQHCYPVLVLPSGIQAADPAWNMCDSA